MIDLVNHVVAQSCDVLRVEEGRPVLHFPQWSSRQQIAHALNVARNERAQVRNAKRFERQQVIRNENKPDHNAIETEHAGQND